MGEKRGRIEFIDLAKGFCILMVVWLHVFRATGVSVPLNELTAKIRMPLYFVLSGMFFKEYEGFFGFLLRKTNKLLIPFFFLYLILTTPWTIIKDLLEGQTLTAAFTDVAMGVYNEYFTNTPTWFLICLFHTSILFYVVYMIAKKCGDHKALTIIILSLLVGAVGLFLSYNRYDQPAYIDTALTATPLYGLGYLLNKHSDILRKSKIDPYLPLIVPLMLIAAYMVAGDLNFISNHYWVHPLLLYPSCALASIAVILLAKIIKRLPWVSYVGRYSVILLMFHWLVFTLVIRVLRSLHVSEGYPLAWTTFFITCIILTLLIPLCKKYLPYVTAQKDLIKVGSQPQGQTPQTIQNQKT